MLRAMTDEERAVVLGAMTPDEVAGVLGLMSADEQAAMLRAMSPADRAVVAGMKERGVPQTDILDGRRGRATGGG